MGRSPSQPWTFRVLAIGAALAAGLVGAWSTWRARSPIDVAPPVHTVRLTPVSMPHREATDVIPLADGRVSWAHDGACYLSMPDGSRSVRVSPTEARCAHPRPWPDGSRVAMQIDGSLVQWHREGTTTMRPQARPLGVSGDGGWLAYVDTATGALGVARSDGQFDQAVLEEPDLAGAIWDARGESLIAWTSGGTWIRVSPDGTERGREAVAGEPVWFEPGNRGLIRRVGDELLWTELGVDTVTRGEGLRVHTVEGISEATSLGGRHRLLVEREGVAHEIWAFYGDNVKDQHALEVPGGFSAVYPSNGRYVLVGDDGLFTWDGRGEPERFAPLEGRVLAVGMDAVVVLRPPRLMSVPIGGGSSTELRNLSGVRVQELTVDRSGQKVAVLDVDGRLLVDGEVVAEGWSPRDWTPDGRIVAIDAEGRVAWIAPGEPPVIAARGVTDASAMDDQRLVLHHGDGTDLLLADGRRVAVTDRQARFLPFGDGEHFVVRQEAVVRELFDVALLPIR